MTNTLKSESVAHPALHSGTAVSSSGWIGAGGGPRQDQDLTIQNAAVVYCPFRTLEAAFQNFTGFSSILIFDYVPG